MPAGAAVLIATKLRAPGLRREYVPRRRLVARLRGGSARRLTLVTAPAGWGKTTLLAAWQAAEGEGSPFAWVSLDEHDNDPARFWSYVVQALREVRPSSAEPACRRFAA